MILSVSAWYRKRWRELCLAAIIVVLFVGVTWYLLENPYNQTFGPTITQVPLHGKYVALTFDDGPNPPYTDDIVQYLHQQHVPATFFVVGSAVAKYPDSVRREAQYGNAIGNHSWDHAHLVLETRRHIHNELAATDQAIFDATGQHTTLFRPPFGARDYAVIQVAHDMGYQVIMWSVPLARDWENPAPQVIANRIVRNVSDGSIIVLHDGNKGRPGDRGPSVEATKLIVSELRAEGYQFVTVPQLIALGVSADRSPPPGSDDMGGEPSTMRMRRFGGALLFLAMAIVATPGCTGTFEKVTTAVSAAGYADECRQDIDDGQLGDALPLCDAAIKLEPTYELAYFYRASLFARERHDSSALSDLNTAISLDSNYFQAYELRANVRIVDHDYDAALRDARSMQQIEPTYSQGYSLQCTIDDELGRDAAARRECDLAERAKVNVPLGYISGSGFAARHGDWQRALHDIDQAVAMSPNDASALNNRCWLKIRMNDVGGAKDDCGSALKLSYNAPYIRDTRADLWFRLRKYDAAIADEDSLIAQEPDSAFGFGGRCAAELQLGDVTRATDDCAHAVKIDKNSEGYWYILRGNVYRAKGDLVNAAADYQRARRFVPLEIEVMREEAWLDVDKRDYAAAASRAHEYVGANPFDPVGHDVYGRALAALGQASEARAQFRLALAGYDVRSDRVGRAQIEKALSALR